MREIGRENLISISFYQSQYVRKRRLVVFMFPFSYFLLTTFDILFRYEWRSPSMSLWVVFIVRSYFKTVYFK